MSKSDRAVSWDGLEERGVQESQASGEGRGNERSLGADEAAGERQLALDIALDRAARRLEPDRVKGLLSQGAVLSIEGVKGHSTLRRVIGSIALVEGKDEKERCEEVAELLLAAGAGPNDLDKFGRSLLHSMVFLAEAGIAQKLIEHGALVGLTDENGNTPAHELAEFKDALTDGAGSHAGLVKVLAMAGADFRALNQAGESPIERSRERGHWALAQAMEAWEESRELSGVLPEKRAQAKPSL